MGSNNPHRLGNHPPDLGVLPPVADKPAAGADTRLAGSWPPDPYPL